MALIDLMWQDYPCGHYLSVKVKRLQREAVIKTCYLSLNWINIIRRRQRVSGLLNTCIMQFKFIPRAIVLSFIVLLAYLFIRDNNIKEVRDKLVSVIKKPWLVMYLLFLSFIMVCTLFSRQSIVPYKSILNGLRLYDNGRWNMQCIENILLFVPYTFFYLQALAPEKPLKAAFLMAFLTSLFIELLQLIFWLGAFQISDLIYNVIGGMIGWLMWFIWKVVTKKTRVS